MGKAGSSGFKVTATNSDLAFQDGMSSRILSVWAIANLIARGRTTAAKYVYARQTHAERHRAHTGILTLVRGTETQNIGSRDELFYLLCVKPYLSIHSDLLLILVCLLAISSSLDSENPGFSVSSDLPVSVPVD